MKSEADKWCDQREEMFNSWEKKNLYKVVDGFIDKLSNKYEIPKSSIYMKQGFNSLLFYSDQFYDGSSSEQLLEVVKSPVNYIKNWTFKSVNI